jgi:glycosyltransferase involved in cell wall biosynthesis
VGGVGIAARRLAGNLAAAGAEVHVVTPVDTPGADSAIECTSENGCQVYRLVDDFRRPDAGFRWRQFVRYLDRDHGFDLFHGFFLTAAYPCLASVEHTKRPLIVSIRGNDALTLIENPYCRAPILAGLRRATWVTSINEAYLQRVREEVDLTGRCSVIRNGVQPVQENALRWKLADRIRGVVGTAGQFRRVKDIPLLIRAYSGLAGKLRRGLLLGGYFVDRDEESWCRTLIGESGLEDEVVLTGPFEQKAVFEWLRAMHVYVQPSAFEGLPNTLLEAACLGVPLVATAVGGMREILTDQEDALRFRTEIQANSPRQSRRSWARANSASGCLMGPAVCLPS